MDLRGPIYRACFGGQAILDRPEKRHDCPPCQRENLEPAAS